MKIPKLFKKAVAFVMSLSGLPVDEYAVTDKNGLAKFENVLISGDTPYVVEEVDTAVRYVVPASQTAPIEWNKVTKRSFDNVLKKFQVTVTKTDAETGSPQGDASLAGAVYGIYKGEELIDTYTTDENGQFTTKYYICDNDWTVREISPSEGYLLDTAIHKVGAESELYTVELNSTSNAVNEQVIKGNIAIIKHTDNGETQIETPEEGAVFEVFLKSAGSYENAKETERDVLTCDKNGFAQTKDILYGGNTLLAHKVGAGKTFEMVAAAQESKRLGLSMSDYLVETKRLTKIYGDQAAVKDVDLHIKKGRIYGLLGRNGAGKTTIMKMILGLTSITSGEVDVFGQNIKGHEKRIYPRIGAIIETPGFYPNLTGTENLEIFAKLRGTAAPDAVKSALEVVGLPYKDKKLFSKYSLGMKQRLGIANAILHDPELLILDEPTNGLDPIGIAEMRDFIKHLSDERGKTILISSHILSEIALLADDIGIIDHGVLLEENTMEVLEKKNRKYILLRISDMPKAMLILEQEFHVTDFDMCDDQTLRLYDTSLDMAAINKALFMREVSVISSQLCNDTLEDYFKRITGGEGIA